MVDRPHFAFPFARGSYVEQDTADHVMSCEHMILRCPLGFRDERPDFGIPWPEFANAPLDADGIERALRRLEPRGNATAEEYADLAEGATRIISIDIEVTQ